MANQQEQDDDRCGTCGRNQVYIGTMCRPCYEERAYPDRKGEEGKWDRRS